jgi:hypothetical protein
MGIQQFELFHGAVLAKLVRSDRPIALRMIETKEEAWAVYTVNDEIELFIKHSTTPRELVREKDGLTWQFIFTPEQVEQIQNLFSTKKVAIALVCGRQNIKDDMQIAFIEPDDVQDLINFSVNTAQSLTVKHLPRKKLRIVTGYTDEKLVAQNALDKWIVPGS